MAREMPDDGDLDDRRTGGAGARRQPLTDREYRREREKLLAMNGK